jgi:hypothetical protein
MLTRIDCSAGAQGLIATVGMAWKEHGSVKPPPTVYPTSVTDSHTTTDHQSAAHQRSQIEGQKGIQNLLYISTMSCRNIFSLR